MREIQQQLGVRPLVEQGRERLPDLGDVQLVDDLAVGELDDAHVLVLGQGHWRE